jgi:two-component system OmpR family sensor kinase
VTIRAWLAGRTLRTRLIAGVFVLLAVSCAGIGVATSITLRGFLVSQLDQQLVQAGDRLDVSRERTDGPGDDAEPSRSGGDPDVQGQAVGTLAVQMANGSVNQALVVHDAAGRVSLSKVALTRADRTTLLNLAPGSAPTTTRLSSLGEYRLRATQSQDGDTHITGLPLHDIESTVHRIEATELIVFGIALLLTGLAGAGWVTLSLRPLKKVTMTARQVSSLTLGSGAVDIPNRVPETDRPAAESQ